MSIAKTTDKEESEVVEYESNNFDSLEVDANSSAISFYFKSIAKYNVLPDKELFELIKMAQNGDVEARDKVFMHNAKLVVYVAKKYMKVTHTLSEMDLIMEGNIGLFTAIEHFDTERGVKFSTYAYNWIKQHITRAIENTDNLIRFPVHSYSLVLKYNSCIDKYQRESGTDDIPSKEYVQEELDINDTQYKNLILTYKNFDTKSLNSLANQDSDNASEIIELISDETTDVFKQVENQELTNIFEDLIERYLLKTKDIEARERKRDMLYRRFGLKGYNIHTLAEVGDRYGVSRERVRQIEEKFIKFCRLQSNLKLLRDFMD